MGLRPTHFIPGRMRDRKKKKGNGEWYQNGLVVKVHVFIVSLIEMQFLF